MAGLNLGSVAYVGSLRGVVAAPPAGLAPLVYQEFESDATKPVRVRYGGAGGFVGQDLSPDYFEGKGNYSTTPGAAVETTIEAGYTRIRFEGIIRNFNCPFDVFVNGVYRRSGFQGATNLYDDLTGLTAGDVVRYVSTSSAVFFVDQFTQLSA